MFSVRIYLWNERSESKFLVMRNGASPCFWVARNGATPIFWLWEMERLRVFELWETERLHIWGYEKRSDSAFVGYVKWSDSAFLGYNYYENLSVFLFFLPVIQVIWKTKYTILFSECPSKTYVKIFFGDGIPLNGCPPIII